MKMGGSIGKDRELKTWMFRHQDLYFLDPPMIEFRMTIGQDKQAVISVDKVSGDDRFQVTANKLV
jgi:hypothetical protein